MNISVCLINPPVLLPKNSVGVDLFQPLGLAYIAAILEDKHYPVSIIDAAAEGWKNIKKFDENRDYNGLDYEQIKTKIKKRAPQVVGITITFTVQKDSAFKVASVVKAIDRKIIVVVGGPHVSVRPEECALNPDIDFAVMGEGEATTLELLKELENKANVDQLKRIKGLAFRTKQGVYVAPRRPVIQDLDSLPLPARDLLPMKTYFEAAKLKRANRDLNKPWATVITSRGCPFNCVFCSVHLAMGRQWRGRSPENIIEELKYLVQKYGVKQIDFEDDNMSWNKERMGRICDLVIRGNLKLEWCTPNGIRADTLDEALLKKMKAAGCRELWFAPESGSQRVVDEIIGKRLDLKYVAKMVAACRKIGISSNCFFVIGLPGETKAEIKKTISFAQKLGRLGADNCLFSIATPLYGTRLYDQAVKEGLFSQGSDHGLMYDKPLLQTSEFTPEELVNLREHAQRENRQAYLKNSLNKLFYYLTHNPALAVEHLNSMSRIGLIFLRRHGARLRQRYVKRSINVEEI